MPLTSDYPKRRVIAAKEDQCWKKKRPNPEEVVEVQSVDSPSRTLIACNEKPNNIEALQRGKPQDSGESIAGPDGQKSSSTAKADQEATSISRDGIGAKLGSDLREQPTVASPVFMERRQDFELEENTKVILEAMEGDGVDISPLRNLLESPFELGASHNKMRSALSEKVEKTAISEVEVHLTNAMIEEEEKAREVSSTRQSLVTVKEKIEKLREKEKNLEALLEVAEKEVEDAKLGASTSRTEYDACCNVDC
ncbi:hypothetical protein A4A49_07345 [Nicotiana attenuata]|uniref:Uncharacterized protein n=1 Tax=Nicotiana attenuata TaxID=49451 RepID=A0A314KT07_NICAT|nr:hypothetical protein A4A49_07345 [Nicotiana attenuata]